MKDVAIVTGASGGIGRPSLEPIKQGYEMILLGRDAKKLKTLVPNANRCMETLLISRGLVRCKLSGADE